MANRSKRTPTKKEKFLKALSTGVPNISKAIKAAAIGRTLAYKWRKEDTAFAQEWENAYQNAVDNLESVAWSRAQRRKAPSDILLIFLLKAHRPERFTDKVNHEHMGKIEIDTAKSKLGKLLNSAKIS